MNNTITLFFTYGYSLQTWASSGILKRDIRLYEELAGLGYDIDFITYGRESEIRYLPVNDRFYVFTRPYRLGMRFYSFLSPILHRNSIKEASLLKTHQVEGSISGVLAKILYHKPLIARCGYLKSVFAELEGEEKKRVRKLAREERLAFRFADIVCVPSQAEARFAAQKYALPLTKFRVCPNWVDEEVFSPAENRPDKFTIIYTARLVKKKGPDILIEAIKGLNGIQVIMIGDGPLRESLEQQAIKYRLSIAFYKNIPNEDLPEYLHQGSVYVLPTHHEGGSPKTILEAMACGLPVISTDGFGVNEVFQDGVHGIKVKFGDVDALRKAILTFKENPELARTMGENGRRRVLEDYSVKRAVERELNILEELTN